MAKNNFAINSFVAGEVSERFFGRFDANQYAQACEEVFNWIIRPQGGAFLRPGTLLVNQVMDAFAQSDPDGPTPAPPEYQDNFTKVRLFPLLGADGSRFQIVAKNHAPSYNDMPLGGTLGIQYASWYVIDMQTWEISPIFPEPLTLSMEIGIGLNYAVLENIDLAEIQYAQIGNRIYFAHTRMRPFYIQYDGASPPGKWFPSSFKLTPLAYTYFDATADGNYSVAQQMPFQAPHFAPTASAPEYVAIKLTTPAGAWDMTTEAQLDTSVGDLGVISTVKFTSGWVGRYLKFSYNGSTTYWEVTAVADANNATVRFRAGASNWGSTNRVYGQLAGTNWEMSYWGGSLGWPAAVTGFEGRLFFGGSIGHPDSYWASQTNNVDRFMVRKFEQDPTFTNPVVATDPFDGTLRAEMLSQIRWMASGKNITCGTNSREFIIQGPNASQSIGPTNIQSNAETPHGSAPASPARIDNATVFLQRDKRTLRELVYSLDEASFQAANLSIIAEHIANKSALESKDEFRTEESYIVEMAMQQVPYGILWACDNNGSLLGMTRERIQQVLAWHYHELGGKTFLTEGGVDQPFYPQVVSVSCAPRVSVGDTLAEPDELWMATRRGVLNEDGNWVPRFYIERMADEWRKATIHQGWNVNAHPFGVQIRVAPVNLDMATMYGTDEEFLGERLEEGFIWAGMYYPGAVLSVVVQGHYLGEFTVNADREIDIRDAIDALELPEVWYFIAGFKYDNSLVPVVPEVPAQLGTAFGEVRRIYDVTVQFVRTIAAKVGRKVSRIEENTPIYPLEDVRFPLPKPVTLPKQLFSGPRKLNFPQGYEMRPLIQVKTDIPLPCEVTHIIAKMVVSEP